MEAGSTGPVDLFDGVRFGVLPSDALLLQAEGDVELSVREGVALAPLSRRACAAALSERRGALHRLQAMRGDLPGAGHHNRGWATAQRRHAADDPLRHRHDEMHLLRLSARSPAPLTPSFWDRTLSSRPRHPRSSTTTRNAYSRMATAGSGRSQRISHSTRPIDEPANIICRRQAGASTAWAGSADVGIVSKVSCWVSYRRGMKVWA